MAMSDKISLEDFDYDGSLLCFFTTLDNDDWCLIKDIIIPHQESNHHLDWKNMWKKLIKCAEMDKEGFETKRKLAELKPNFENFITIIEERRKIFFDVWKNREI